MKKSNLIDEAVRIAAFHSWSVEDEAYGKMLKDLKELVTKAYQQGQKDMIEIAIEFAKNHYMNGLVGSKYLVLTETQYRQLLKERKG
jgi:hypothetical protein